MELDLSAIVMCWLQGKNTYRISAFMVQIILTYVGEHAKVTEQS